MTRLPTALLVLASVACGSPAAPQFPEADTRILFVGNSLTAANDLPGLTATIATAAGHSVAVLGITAPNYSLEEHWRAGLAARIADLRPDVVVFQQGPSSLRESRTHLLQWTDSVAPVVAAAGGRVAFLMVWPERARLHAFDDVRESYRLAAERAGGTFIPAGEAWRPLLEPEAPRVPDPYGPDGFHPSHEGSVLAAYVVVRALFGSSVQGLPARLDARGGHPAVHLDAATAVLLQRLADDAVAAWP